MLGGSVEFLADAKLREQGLEPAGDTAEAYEAAWDGTLDEIKAQVKAEHDEVKEAGGLYVIGTERHESRRIDNQLRGRSGRQGDPGESRFYLSLQDEMMRLFKSDMVERILLRLKVPDDVPIDSKMVSNSIAGAQGNLESQNFESRKNVLKYDDVMSAQREVIYGQRRRVLEGADLEEQIRNFIGEVISDYVTSATAGLPDEWDVEALDTALKQLYPVTTTVAEMAEKAGGLHMLSREVIISDLVADATAAYDAREAEVGEEVMRELERRVVLSVIDRKWREHLYEMDYLREGIYLRAYSQRDPLVEYQREGYDMFQAMMDAIKEESVGFLFNLQVEVEADEAPAPVGADGGEPLIDMAQAEAHAPHFKAKGLEKSKKPQNLSYSAPDEDGEEQVVASGTVSNADDPYAGVGRNADCPCGSGKKFKKCHGQPGGPTGLTTRVNG